jgi:hypothetical protein
VQIYYIKQILTLTSYFFKNLGFKRLKIRRLIFFKQFTNKKKLLIKTIRNGGMYPESTGNFTIPIPPAPIVIQGKSACNVNNTACKLSPIKGFNV